MSDQLLREAENDESGDVDAATLDDVVERVKAAYKEDFQAKVSAEQKKTLEERARADEAERVAAERERRREVVIARRAQTFAKWVTGVGWWVLVPAIIVGAIALISESILHLKASLLVVLAVIIFIVLEALANLKQVSEWRASTKTLLAGKVEAWLRADSLT